MSSSLPRRIQRVLAQAVCALLTLGSAPAQELSLQEVLDWTLDEHPAAELAAAVEARGVAELMAARGAYDPTVTAGADHKSYLGTEYFTYGDVGLSWQSPLALKLEAGRQWADGTYLNQERTVPADGQAYLSLKLPVLQGLLTDKYRTEVAQGKLAVDRNRAAANVIRNELRYDVTVAYAEWVYAERVLLISRETESLIEQRLSATRDLYQQGDKPAVDTLEATVALANQRLNRQEAVVALTLAQQTLQTLYWPLRDESRPANQAGATLQLPFDTISPMRNPALTELRVTAAQLSLEQRLKREYRKPELNLSYSLLGDGFDLAPGSEELGHDRIGAGYKLGATFRYPLLTRTARANQQITALKVAETRAKQAVKTAELQRAATGYRQAVRAFDAQLQDAEALVEQTRTLLTAERELFGLGESTQFLLNSREQTLQKALLTVEKLQLSRTKSAAAVWKSIGR